MITLSVFYPKTATSRFDMNYYVTSHIPLVRRLLGRACVNAVVEEGLAGGEPGAPPAYAAIGVLSFESIESMQQAMTAHGTEIRADVPNYTNVVPIVQVSEVKLAGGSAAVQDRARDGREVTQRA
jgi:uncharacterized protein (TIGR02118 family)